MDRTLVLQLLENIFANQFMTLKDYRQQVKAGAIPERRIAIWGDGFEEKYPDHPLGEPRKTNRMAAADSIRDHVRNTNRPLPTEVLSKLHGALFDCCAAVRQSIAIALFYAGDESSIEPLKQLIETEKDSPSTVRYAKAAWSMCKSYSREWSLDKYVFVITRSLELAADLADLCAQMKVGIHFPPHPYTDLIAVSSDVQVVDRYLFDEENWNAYCEYLEDVNETETEFPIRDENGEILMEKPLFDHTPLIIVDNQKAADYRKPNKPNECIYYLNPEPTDLVCRIVETALQKK